MGRTDKNSHKKEIIEKLQKAGIEIREGKPSPKNGRYSAIVGHLQNEIILNIPNWPNDFKEKR
ncbi:hypothetical protein [Salirhabdus sp. Marseille-P4669]|uniref:hypothetical protein n=1 Tax=Salirhabdus sp. Marseille-P4669 TaxID=2042310 RepID=UPI000C7C2253|nr:hypothetical protein [Salirhabdus sp. Marseille-P4669]